MEETTYEIIVDKLPIKKLPNFTLMEETQQTDLRENDFEYREKF